MKKKMRLSLVGLFFFFLLSPLASAGEATRALLTVIVASNEGSGFDLDNDAYRDELIKLFSYSSYRQVKAYAVDLEKGRAEKVELPEGYELFLTFRREEKGRVMVHASIQKAGRQYLDTILSILKPGTVFLGGPPVEDGFLILVLEAGY